MANNRFQLDIIVPEKVYFSGEVDSISVETSKGQLTIMAHHMDLIGDILISHLCVKQNGHIHYYAVAGGTLNVYRKENKVVMLVNAIEAKEEIDAKRATLAKERAETKLTEEISFRDQQKAEIKLKRAINRLSLVDKK